MSEAIASIKRVKEILTKYDLKAQKQFGQNFLINEAVVKKIALLACEKDLPTLEVGPGIGSLTQQLAQYSKHVYAYEIDKKLPTVLKEELKDYNNITVICQDFLKLDLAKDLPLKQEFTFCSNLPYYITTPILFKLMRSSLPIKKITVMVQKEVADRLLAKPKSSDYGALSVIISYLYNIKKILEVKSSSFMPSPKVESSVIQLLPLKERLRVKNEEAFFSFIQKCFAQRRKTLFNNLRNFLSTSEATTTMLELGLNIETRAQELDVETFISLYGAIYEGKSICEN